MIRRLAACTCVLALGLVPGAETHAAVTLPVVRCPTTYGVEGTKPRPVPRRLIAHTAAALAGRLAFYSNGWVSLLGPRSWHCSGLVAADGNLSLSVLPPYVADVSRQAAALTAFIPTACTGCVAVTACPFFPEARKINPRVGCPRIPARESIERRSAHAVAFDDPPRVRGTGNPSGGPYPAHGVVLFNGVIRWTRDAYPAAAQETCTLLRRNVRCARRSSMTSCSAAAPKCRLASGVGDAIVRMLEPGR